jgi:hypothetical protein
LDEAIRCVTTGEKGLNIAITAVYSALVDRAARGARQVEEHYFRESKAPRAYRVRDRIEQAIDISTDNIRGLAFRVLKLETASTTNRAMKRQGIDDGVTL